MATRGQSAVFAALLTVWLPVVSVNSAASLPGEDAEASSTVLPTPLAGQRRGLFLSSVAQSSNKKNKKTVRPTCLQPSGTVGI